MNSVGCKDRQYVNKKQTRYTEDPLYPNNCKENVVYFRNHEIY